MPLRARRLFTLAGIAACGGLVAAALAVPFVGGAGLLTARAIDRFHALPTVLELPSLPERSRLLASDGSVLARFFQEDRHVIPFERISPHLVDAVLAVEDARFFDHAAIDVKGTLRAAIVDLWKHRKVQGGSTLTQQYVKNVLAHTGAVGATESTIGRKLREARLAIALEKRLSKRQILQNYLNLVYLGHGAYGVAAAARRYFGTSAKHLTIAQSALLAGLVQSPSRLDPFLHPKEAMARRAIVLRRMAKVGDISRDQADRLAREPLRLHPATYQSGCRATSAPFFCDWIRRLLLREPALGNTPAEREHTLLTGGLTIRTTLDPTTQRAAQRALDATLPHRHRLAGAMAIVEPGTGKVLALASNRRFGNNARRGETRVNLPVGGSSGFQAGSTFKTFTLASAIDQGMELSHTMRAPRKISFRHFDGCSGDLGAWKNVQNAAANEQGWYSLVGATWRSVNTYFAKLEHRTGVCGPWRLAKRVGIQEVSTGRPAAQVPAFTLGVADTSPLQVAGAYAMFAARGVYCAPYGVSLIRSARAEERRDTSTCHRVLTQDVADEVTSVLRGVVDGPDPARTGAGASIGRPAAGKTGTTDGNAAAWFSGYTPQLAASVWVGDPRGGASHPLVNVRVRGHYYPQIYGGDLPATAWRRAMLKALKGVAVADFDGSAARVARDIVEKPKRSPDADVDPDRLDRQSAVTR